jgi:hypothetical protein
VGEGVGEDVCQSTGELKVGKDQRGSSGRAEAVNEWEERKIESIFSRSVVKQGEGRN